jgi:hypothetical protein
MAIGFTLFRCDDGSMVTKDSRPSITPNAGRGLSKLAQVGEVYLRKYRSDMTQRESGALEQAISFARRTHEWKVRQKPQEAIEEES